MVNPRYCYVNVCLMVAFLCSVCGPMSGQSRHGHRVKTHKGEEGYVSRREYLRVVQQLANVRRELKIEKYLLQSAHDDCKQMLLDLAKMYHARLEKERSSRRRSDK